FISKPLERSRLRLDALADALYRSEGLSCRTAHEAGSDEHGNIDREPCAVPGSSVRRVFDARAGPSENQRQREIHIEEGSRRPAPARDYLSREDGFSNSITAVAAGAGFRRTVQQGAG